MLAIVLSEQVFDNCLMAARLLDEGHLIIASLNDLMTAIVKDAGGDVCPE